jgi:hypothetical protein
MLQPRLWCASRTLAERTVRYGVDVKKSFVALTVLCALLGAIEAHTSQVMLQQVSLAQLAAQSDVVVIAHPATPPTVTHTVDITPAGQKPNPQKWPPFVWTDARWVVDEVLFSGNRFGLEVPADAAQARAGDTIVVEGANTQSSLYLHRMYYVDGTGESPIYDSYAAQGTTTSSSRILFLSRQGAGFAQTMNSAVEWIEHRASVVAALQKPLTPTSPKNPTPAPE